MPYQIAIGLNVRDQTLPFMFEVVDPSTGMPMEGKTYILPFNPENYRYTPAFRSNVTMTQGGSFEDNIGLGLPKISLSGTFGFLGTLPTGSNARHFESAKKDGWALYYEVEQLMLDFYKDFGGDTKTNLPELRFYNYTDKHFYQVKIDQFALSRSIQRRHLYQYDIQMTGLKPLLTPFWSEDEITAILMQPEVPSPKPPWAALLTGYLKLDAAMQAVMDKVQVVETNLGTVRAAVAGFANGVTALIKAPFTLVRDTISTIDAITAAAITIVDAGLPMEFICDMREMKRDLLQLTFHQDKFAGFDTTANLDTTPTTLTEIMTAPLPQGVMVSGLSVSMDIPESSLFAAGIDVPVQVAAKEEPIRDNDTIESLAQRTLGSARDWQKLANLNGLEYPYVATGLNAFTPILATGQVVQITGRTIYTLNFLCQPGEIVFFDYREPAIVESFDENVLTITSSLQNAYASRVTITRHERALAVLQPGDKMKIPSVGQSALTSITPSDILKFQDQLYGIDELLDVNGNGQIGPDNDMATIAGLENLEMQLGHRLKTKRGELSAVGHPEYGSYLPYIIGKTTENIWYERAVLETQITLLDDPRIESIKSLELQGIGSAIYAVTDVIPVGQVKSSRLTILVN